MKRLDSNRKGIGGSGCLGVSFLIEEEGDDNIAWLYLMWTVYALSTSEQVKKKHIWRV